MRSTIQKQTSLIARYCLAAVVLLALLGPLAQKGRGDFSLQDDEWLTVNSFHDRGYLYDTSRVFIVTGGLVHEFHALESSAVNIVGGSVDEWFYAGGSSVVNITGGSVNELHATDSSTVNLSGGIVSRLEVSGHSMVTFYGRNFSVGEGLLLFGDRVVGAGLLTGEWFDGTPWAVNIAGDTISATILVTSDSEPNPICAGYPAMDFDRDCKVGFSDLAIFLTHWLECNLEPPSACWE